MTSRVASITRWGRPQALVALATAGAAGWVTVATTTRHGEAATQFVSFGLAVFILALVMGSRFAVGGAVALALIGAVIEIGTVSAQRWERSLVIACLWYVAAELAWDSMERRDGRQRPLRVNLERAREVGTVLVVTLLTTLLAAALIGSAPPRTLVVLAVIVGGLAGGLVVAARHLSSTGSEGDGAA